MRPLLRNRSLRRNGRRNEVRGKIPHPVRHPEDAMRGPGEQSIFWRHREAVDIATAQPAAYLLPLDATILARKDAADFLVVHDSDVKLRRIALIRREGHHLAQRKSIVRRRETHARVFT